MPNNPITDEQLAELDRLFDRRRECNKDAAKWAQSISICYRPLRQRLLAAEARLAEVERERDAYKAQCLSVLEALTIQEHEQMARDARQRREGAAAGIEQAREMLSVAESGEEADEMMRKAAKRLRDGGK